MKVEGSKENTYDRKANGGREYKEVGRQGKEMDVMKRKEKQREPTNCNMLCWKVP